MHTWSKLDQPKAFPRDSGRTVSLQWQHFRCKALDCLQTESKKNKQKWIEKGKEKRWNENPNSEVQSSWILIVIEFNYIHDLKSKREPSPYSNLFASATYSSFIFMLFVIESPNTTPN